MASKTIAVQSGVQTAKNKVAEAILDLVIRVPATSEAALEMPQTRAHNIGRAASRKASLLASSMALPPGFIGWLTLVPELVAVWKLQSQMVSDIAGVYGKSTQLSREQMLYCLFKHVSAQLVRDVVVRAGERFLVQRASNAFLQSLVKNLGLRVTQTLVGKSASRFVPLIGAIGVGAYAYFDTAQVARTAMELFANDIVINHAAP